MPISILVIGAENPRVRYLFDEVGRYAKVFYMNIQPPAGQQLNLSEQAAEWLRGDIESKFGSPNIIVFTWPQLAPLAEKFPRATRVYYCKDPFEHWACWDREKIHALESQLLENVDALFAVSRLLVEDFRPRTRAACFYLPNAVEQSFLNSGPLPRPANLPVDKPIVGCVGHVNSTYDWDYIAELAENLPEARLCLIGDVSDVHPQALSEIVNRLARQLDIRFLGLQPHEQIPAYMQHFDISACLLKAGEYADRRSPLRLYDYLTTEKPIISTPVREAREHLPHIHIADTGKDAAALARRILAGEIRVDVPGRRNYIAEHTWPVRASQLFEHLVQLPKLGASAHG
jgi:hypothetical protein